MKGKMLDAREDAEERMLTPDKILEQKELAREAHRVVTSFLGSLDEETKAAIIRSKAERSPFRVLAKQTEKASQARLRTKISRAYRKMRKRVPLDLRRALVHVYRGGDLEYAKQQSKKSK